MWVFTLLLCVALSFAARSYEKYDIDKAEDYFKEFVNTYNKQYANEAEKLKRFEIFKQNLEIINQLNVESDDAVFGINKFSDLTSEEFIATYTGLNDIKVSNCDNKVPQYTKTPGDFDWRKQNKVTSVKDQKSCGGCWAFSAVGNLESQYAIKYNQTFDFSEQQLIDCDRKSFGCDGTYDLSYPFKYWMEHGPMMEEDYAFEGHNGRCRDDDSKAKPKISGCTVYSTRDEQATKQPLHDSGPLSIGIDASSVQYYKHGIMKKCTFRGTNHAVLLVGYGTENGTPFWIVKNSWGETWGEEGYFRIKRGVNSCGLMNYPMVTGVLA